MFTKMTDKELRAYIDGCHKGREYDDYFEAACRELQSRNETAIHLPSVAWYEVMPDGDGMLRLSYGIKVF